MRILRRLSSVGSRSLRHRKGRSALTSAGIALGVAILFGVLVSNATTQSGIDTLITDFTGRADVLVDAPGSFEATMPSSTIARLRRLPGVATVAGSFTMPSSLEIDGERREIQVRGIDPTVSRAVADYTLEAGRFFTPRAAEVIVPRRLLDRLGIGPGATLRIATPAGLQGVRIVGVLADRGGGRTNQGDVAFTSLPTIRRLAGVGDVLTGALVVLNDGVEVDGWIEEHRTTAGAGLLFRDATALAGGFKDFLAILGSTFTAFAMITLFVGAFLIYLTLSMAVIERIRMYGTMRALGATRQQVRRVVMSEALALGAVSTLIGLVLGLGIAKGLLALMSSLFEIDLPSLTIPPSAIVASVIVGLLTTVLSALVPARRAARLSPVVAMRGDHGAQARLSRAWIVGAVSASIGLLVGLTGGPAGSAVATPLLLLGAVLLVPLLLRPLARFLGRATARISKGVGEIAVFHLVKERSRSAYTLALIMVVMAMIFAIGGLSASMGQALDRTLDTQFGSDFNIENPGAFGDAFERDLRAVPGVGLVAPIRFGFTKLIDEDDAAGRDVFVRIVDPASYFAVEGFLVKNGSAEQAAAALQRGGSVLLPHQLWSDLDEPERVTLATSLGEQPFDVAATYTSFLPGPPEMVMGLRDGRTYLQAAGANSFHVNIAEGAAQAAVARAIEDRLGPTYGVEVQTANDLKAEARTQFARFFSIFYAIVLVAAVVGLLGLANTLAMSVLQRWREIGILRAIGVTRPQVRRLVLVESATLVLVAFALAIPFGALLAWLIVRSFSGAVALEVEFVYPIAWVPVVAIFGAIVAVSAAIAPGRRAARLQVVEALQVE